MTYTPIEIIYTTIIVPGNGIKIALQLIWKNTLIKHLVLITEVS